MKYIQADIHVNREGIEPVLTALMNVDIMDTVVEDPADIADLLDKDQDWEWDYVDDSVIEMQNAEPKVTVYMEDDEEGRRKLAALQGAIEELKADAAAGAYGEDVDLGPLTVDVYVEDDSEWKDNWKEFFKPKKVGKRIVVKP